MANLIVQVLCAVVFCMEEGVVKSDGYYCRSGNNDHLLCSGNARTETSYCSNSLGLCVLPVPWHYCNLPMTTEHPDICWLSWQMTMHLLWPLLVKWIIIWWPFHAYWQQKSDLWLKWSCATRNVLSIPTAIMTSECMFYALHNVFFCEADA